MNNDKNIKISEAEQNINVINSDIEVLSQEEIVATNISATMPSKVDVEDAEIVDIIIDEAFPYATPENIVNHSLLHGRDLPEQHPISAITGLEDELNDIKAIKPVYSSHNGLSEFRKWHDDNPNGENRSGYFVSIINGDDIQICDSIRNVYGVTVSASGFIGNQNDFDKSDDYTYAMVGIVGTVNVRTDGTARDGEYVIPNKLGEATFSENGYGYKVLSQGSYPSYNYVTIAITPQNGALGVAGSGSGSGELGDIIIEIDDIKNTMGNLQVQIDGAMSPDDVQDIINENLADLNKKVENANTIAQTANTNAQQAQANASQAASIATQAQQAAQSAAKEAIDTAKQAGADAQNAIDIANSALSDVATNAEHIAEIQKTSDEHTSSITNITQQINETNQNITLIQQKSDDNEAAIISAVQRIDENSKGLTSIQQQVNENEASINSVVERVDENGKGIASITQQAKQNETIIQHLVSHVDKYSIGEYSLSYGLTHEEAKSVLTSEHIYIPTNDHTEVMKNDPDIETTFERNYVYTWDVVNGQWVKSDKPISTATTYQDGTVNGDLWFCWQDVERFDENGEVVDTYIGGTLYRWFDNKWVAVATNADNHQGRILTSVKQTAESIQSDVVDLQGNLSSVEQTVDGLSITVKANEEGIKKNTTDIAAVNVRADEINATIARVETETKEEINTVNQTMSSIQMSVQDNTNAITLINTGRYHVSFWNEIGNAPEVYDNGHKYSEIPVWDDELGAFVFNDDFVDDENGIYYFYSDDKTKYCKLTDDGYELYTIGNQATSSLNQRVTDNEAGLNLLVEYKEGELKDSLATINLKADANSANINYVTSYYYHTLLSISETEIPVIDGELRYNSKPTWDAAAGKYVFDIADRAEDGAYYLADSQGSTYCKVVAAGDGSTLYEIYGLAGSYMAAIQQGADENGGYIQSIVMDIERYNVGQYSPSYGMSYDDAVISIPKGTMYVPTIAHSENLIPDERVGTDQLGIEQLDAGTLEEREADSGLVSLPTTPFDALEVTTMQTYDFEVGDTQTYSHEWDGTGWQKGDAVSLSQEYYSCDDDAEAPKLWYCVKDVSNPQEVIEGKGGVYKQGTLYAWHGGRWFAVATVSDSLLSRSLSLVRQTANSYSIELRNMQGDFSQYKQTVNSIGMLVSGADGSSGSLNLTKEGIVGEIYNRTGNSATLKAQADATQAVLDLAISGLYHKLEQPLADNVPEPYNNGNRYSSRPTWVASLGKFVFYESTKADDGVYYFFDNDETHYCKVVGEQYEIYTIGTLSTASTDAHITEEFANISTLAFYGDDETSTIAGLRNLALENKAQVQLLASLDNSKLLRVVDVHGYTVPEGTKRYATKPVYLNGSFTFDGQAEDENGDYFLINSQQFGKLITNTQGGCYGYEVYEHDTSSTAGLVSTVLENQANVGMIVDVNGVKGKVVIDAINGESTATIEADRVNLNGYVTITSLADNSTTTINGAEICSGVIRSNNYVEGASPFSGEGTYIDLSDGSIASKNFAIDNEGNLYLKGDISATNARLNGGLKVGSTDGETYNFIVDPNGNVTVKGVLDATDLRINGVGVLTTDDKISADYLELRGLTIRNSSNQITLQIDSNGNVTLSGSISWYDITDVPYTVTEAYDVASSAATDAEDAYNMAYNAEIMAEDANDTVSGWRYRSTTYIDGSMLMTGTVMASSIQGGEVILLDDDANEAGVMTLTEASTSNYAVDLTSYAALRLTANSGSVYLTSDTHFINIQSGSGITFGGDTTPGYNESYSVRPSSNGGLDLGMSGKRWGTVYATTGEIDTSDRDCKKNIEYNLGKYEDFYFDLKPTQYKLIENTSNRYHVGFISQDVEESLQSTGLTSYDFAGFVKSPKKDDDGNVIEGYEYGLRYSEFVALNTHMIQKLYKRIEELETKLNNISEEKE